MHACASTTCIFECLLGVFRKHWPRVPYVYASFTEGPVQCKCKEESLMARLGKWVGFGSIRIWLDPSLTWLELSWPIPIPIPDLKKIRITRITRNLIRIFYMWIEPNPTKGLILTYFNFNNRDGNTQTSREFFLVTYFDLNMIRPKLFWLIPDLKKFGSRGLTQMQSEPDLKKFRSCGLTQMQPEPEYSKPMLKNLELISGCRVWWILSDLIVVCIFFTSPVLVSIFKYGEKERGFKKVETCAVKKEGKPKKGKIWRSERKKMWSLTLLEANILLPCQIPI